jgi:hypothetical protein
MISPISSVDREFIFLSDELFGPPQMKEMPPGRGL